MSDCCSSPALTHEPPQKYRCPVNGKEYSGVSANTILHHIKAPWQWQSKEQGYYFCDDPHCDVVYFGQDDSIIDRRALRTVVGIKQATPDAAVCYCFGLNKIDAATNAEAKAFVIEQTKKQACACTIRNPSGKCCLKDFPKS
jgi:hypothetical protein